MSIFRRFKKFKFGSFLRHAVESVVPPLTAPLEAGAAAIRQAKKAGKGVDEQAAVAMSAGLANTPEAQKQKTLTFGLLGIAALVVLIMMMRRSRSPA